MITYKIHATNWREEQYEIFYDLFKDGKVVVGNQTKTIGKIKIDEVEIEKIMNTSIIPLFESRSNEVDEVTYTKEEVEVLLVEKGYLTDEQSLEDLKENTSEVIK